LCAIVNLGSAIWSALAPSYLSFLGARILTGTGAAANESIMTVVVADMYFLHERGSYVGFYFWCYFVGLFLGPIISGSVAGHVSWRWFFWACALAQGINLIGLVFLFPETRRRYGEMLPTLSSNRSPCLDLSSENEKASALHVEYENNVSQREACVQNPMLGRGKPSHSQFKLLQPIDHVALRNVFSHLFAPVYIISFPIIFWASMAMGSAANALLAVNILQSQAFSAPPYNFTPAQVGYANFALVAGGVLGLLIAGPWSDWLSARATKNNRGIREPEMRLPSLVPFIVAALVGLVVFGVGVQRKWPWPAVIVIGFGLVGLQVVAIPTLAITYAIDSYKPATGEIMVIATVCKNTFGFGMTYYMPGWAVADGFVPPVMMIMAMTVGISIIGVVAFMFFGKSCRRLTRNSKIHSF
jgi:MFS family permease